MRGTADGRAYGAVFELFEGVWEAALPFAQLSKVPVGCEAGGAGFCGLIAAIWIYDILMVYAPGPNSI